MITTGVPSLMFALRSSNPRTRQRFAKEPADPGAASSWPSRCSAAAFWSAAASDLLNFSPRTQIKFAIGAGISGSIQLKHWITPACRQRSSNSRRSSDEATRLSRLRNLIRIEDGRGVAVRIEMDERAFLIEIEMLSEPVERTGVAVFDIDRHGGRSRERTTRKRERKNRRAPPNRHRAG